MTHNVDVFEVLSDLEDLVSGWGNDEDFTFTIQEFISQQRSIYEEAKGECAA